MSESAPAHPEARTMVAFIEGRLPAEELAAVSEHLRGCPDCRTVVTETARFEIWLRIRRFSSSPGAPAFPWAQNRVVTILAGTHVKPGYREASPFTHVNLLRTLEAMYGLARSGAQQPFALRAGISDDAVLTGMFQPALAR